MGERLREFRVGLCCEGNTANEATMYEYFGLGYAMGMHGAMVMQPTEGRIAIWNSIYIEPLSVCMRYMVCRTCNLCMSRYYHAWCVCVACLHMTVIPGALTERRIGSTEDTLRGTSTSTSAPSASSTSPSSLSKRANCMHIE